MNRVCGNTFTLKLTGKSARADLGIRKYNHLPQPLALDQLGNRSPL